jgi:hypothetical protein
MKHDASLAAREQYTRQLRRHETVLQEAVRQDGSMLDIAIQQGLILRLARAIRAEMDIRR